MKDYKYPRRKVHLLVEATNHFGRTIVEGIARFAREQDWDIHFSQRGHLDPVEDILTLSRYDGIISRTFSQSSAELFQRVKIPLVELVGEFSNCPPDIQMNLVEECRMVLNHFKEHGLTRFAFFSALNARWTRNRIELWRSLAGANSPAFLPKTQTRELLSLQWKESDQKRLAAWLESLEKPVGIFIAKDDHAEYLYDAADKIGLKIPEDIAVVGAENDPWYCNLLNPTLSSVDQNGFETGYQAAKRLEEKMSNPRAAFPPVYIVPDRIEVRQSSDVMSIEDEDVRQVLAFIRLNACRGIVTADISKSLDISIRKIQRDFKRLFNKTPLDIMLEIQMDTAKQLLRETRLSVQAISHRVGFSTPEYFVKAFKREVGVTPIAYRRKTGQ